MEALLLIVLMAIILAVKGSSHTHPCQGIGVPPPPQPRGRRSFSSLERPPSLLSVEVGIECQGDKKRLQGHIDSGAQGKRSIIFTSFYVIVPFSDAFPHICSSVTVMTLSAARRLSLVPHIDRSLATKAIGVGVGSIVGRIRGVRITVGDEIVACDVAVLEDGRGGDRNVECLVGLDVLNKLEAVIDVRRGITLRGGRKIPWVNSAPKMEQQKKPARQLFTPPSPRALRRHSPPPHPSTREEPTYNPDTDTYIPPVDLEVEAELDQLDDDEIEEIIRREDKDDVRGMERKYDYINGQVDEEEEIDESESESDFDMSGV